MRWAYAVFGPAVWVILAAGCGPQAPPPARVAEPAAARPAPVELFSEQAAAAGLDFVHFNGMTGEHHFNEMMGGGAALFDYDNDGDLDVYLVQGGVLVPGASLSSPPPFLGDRLYRNDLEIGDDGRTQLKFTDVTETSAVEAYGYGMGVAAGDYDNDGRVDLYVTNFGENQLLRNNGADVGGGVTFSDVTEVTGTGDRRWSVSASFFDYDRDGWLDLYVGNYVGYTLAAHRPCRAETGTPVYCSPLAYSAQPDRLFHNRGGTAGRGVPPKGGPAKPAAGRVTFEDVSRRNGFTADYGSALGAVTADFDGDGWIDLYVANDGMPNQLWIQRRGTFENVALLAGAAVNDKGEPEASMGLAAADFDGDGDEDLFTTHLRQETNTVYVNDGKGLFAEATIRSGLGRPSLEFTSFGTAWIDYDNDGWLDVLTVNGAVADLEPLLRAGDPFPLHQTNQLLRNLGEGRFAEVTDRAGAAFELSEVSRGAAFGDIDNDGDVDVVVVNNNGPVRLLINEVGSKSHWLGLRLIGETVSSNKTVPRDMLGARVAVFLPGRAPLWRRVHTDGSYASASDPRVLVGLGESPPPVEKFRVEKVRVEWPDGRVEEWNGPSVDRYHTLRQGEGTAVDPE